MRRTAKTPPKKTRAGEVAEAEQFAGWLEIVVLSMSVSVGEWAVGQWIVSVISFQKIYGLYSSEYQKVEKWSKFVVCGWVLWVWWVCVGDG